MLGNPGSYANKKRKKPVLKHKKITEGNETVKSNPSKRHRDRLNGELDRLTDLLPFSDDIRTRLDKLSVLRLSVGYLRVKSYYNATLKNSKSTPMLPGLNGNNGSNGSNGTVAGFSEGDMLLQALNGFVIVVTAEGLVFYVSPTIKDFLGFHQSDVIHQSVFELIHTDDRSLFRQQLHFSLNPPPGADGDVLTYRPEQLPPENSSFLERDFVCRFRCLLDNSSGFLALKFQGRLKYLHGQEGSRDNVASAKPQLALFSIAVPVNPPSIVEIRAKMILFQSKHKLDFTPMGMDSRGRAVLGYTEMELCMKGTGYQFIHAADMMYCADSHIHMIKTGETGLIVFRLLTKWGSWVWVKSNAKLIYKGERPEFIIAHQRALSNSEGEEYLRQRWLQLPFSYTTGEAVLYDSGPTMDVTHLQFNKRFSNDDAPVDVTPGSLVDCLLKQDESAYTQTINAPLPLDQMFMDSRALLSVPSNAWQENGAASTTGAPVVVKEEAKQSVMNMINKLERLAQDGDLCSVLEGLDIPDVGMMELENTLNSLGQEENQKNSVASELDEMLINDIFDYIDGALFKDKDSPNGGTPSCLTAANNQHQDAFAQSALLCEPQMFQTPKPDHPYPPVNGVYPRQQDVMNGSGVTERNLTGSAQVFGTAQKLSHPPPPTAQADTSMPPLQHLQLQDIFSPSIELPPLTVPDTAPQDAATAFQSCRQAHMRPPQGIPAPAQSIQALLCPQSNLQAPVNRELLQNSAMQPNHVALGVSDMIPPLVPCKDFNSSMASTAPLPFPAGCLRRSQPLPTVDHQVQQWPQNQQQAPPHAGIMQNGHEPTPACHGQTSEGLPFPPAGLWPGGGPELNHGQQGGLACGQTAAQSSCMFNQHFDVMALSGSSGLRGADMCQSPPQGSCYFQWKHSEPVVGTSAIVQESATVSPLMAPSSALPSEHTFSAQHYLEGRRQTQGNMFHCGLENYGQQGNFKRK